MSTSLRFTIDDLEALPDPLDDTRYELIEGALSVAKQPHWSHQFAGAALFAASCLEERYEFPTVDSF